MICNSCGNDVDSSNRFCPKCGASVQYQSPASEPAPYSPPQQPGMPGPMAQPPRKSSCGKIILILIVILLLLGAGIAAAIYFGYRYAEKTLKSSEAYTVAVKALKENPQVRERLGEISDTGFPIGAYTQNSDGSGEAAFTMSVQGTKESGRYQVALKRRNSIWQLENGFISLPNGETIQVAETSFPYGSPTNVNTNSSPDTDLATNENANSGVPISGGVLNGKAISLPKPAYPPIAKAAKASGAVTVQVLVDEKGNVVTARAVSGHPLLQAAAVAAARQAKFSPTKLSGKPVKVVGIITYNFAPEP